MAELPRFQAGQSLLASDLNKIVDALIRRIVPGRGIDVRFGNGVVTIGLNGQYPIPVQNHVVIGKITVETGLGVYEWTKEEGIGPDSGSATELNLVEEIPIDTLVELHKIGGSWWFSYSALSSGSTNVIARITSEVGAGVYNWTKEMGEGPASGTATELNASTGIVADTIVVLQEVEGDYFFFYPIEECP